MKRLIALSLLAAVTLLSNACTMHNQEPQAASVVQTDELSPEERYPTSLHARGASDGLENVYEDGLGRLTQIPYGDLPCHGCHPETYADGSTVDEANYEPGCRDCHATPGDAVPQDRCLECHENGLYGSACIGRRVWSAWTATPRTTSTGTGASWRRCMTPMPSRPTALSAIPKSRATPYTVDCSACHIETSETCYSCHFESYVEGGYQDRVLTQHDGFIMLVNRKNGKVHPATYQSTVWKGKSFVGILPTFSHSVRKAEDARGCGDCHANDAVDEYQRTGRIWVAKWNEESKSLKLRKGIIPVPPNWPSVLIFDQVTYGGSPNDPVPGYPSDDPENWTYLGNVPDVTHDFKDYVEPLTREQMEKLKIRYPPE